MTTATDRAEAAYLTQPEPDDRCEICLGDPCECDRDYELYRDLEDM